MMMFHSLRLEEQGLRCNSEPGRALFYKLGYDLGFHGTSGLWGLGLRDWGVWAVFSMAAQGFSVGPPFRNAFGGRQWHQTSHVDLGNAFGFRGGAYGTSPKSPKHRVLEVGFALTQ